MEVLFIALLILALLLFTKIIDLFFKALEITIKFVVPAVVIIFLIYLYWDNSAPRRDTPVQHYEQKRQPEESPTPKAAREISAQRMQMPTAATAKAKRVNISPSDLNKAQLDRAVVEEYSNRYVITIYK